MILCILRYIYTLIKEIKYTQKKYKMNYSDNMDQIDIYRVVNFDHEQNIQNMSDYTQPCAIPDAQPCAIPDAQPCAISDAQAQPCVIPDAQPCVIPVGSIKEINTKYGKKGQSAIVMVNGSGLTTLKQYFNKSHHGSNVNRVNLYIPSKDKNDNVNTLYISMAVLSNYLKEHRKDFDNFENFVEKYNDMICKILDDKLALLDKHDLLSKTSFNIKIYMLDDDKSTIYGFINFKKSVTPWQVAIVRLYLKQYCWDMISDDEKHYIDVRINKLDRNK